MIKYIKIKCPRCGQVSKLFLSMNPDIIILNCPKCISPLMYNNSKVYILSKKDLKLIEMSPVKSVLDSNYNEADRKHFLIKNISPAQNKSQYPKKQISISSSISSTGGIRKDPISSDDIIDLSIELARCKDVTQFIKKL